MIVSVHIGRALTGAADRTVQAVYSASTNDEKCQGTFQREHSSIRSIDEDTPRTPTVEAEALIDL